MYAVVRTGGKQVRVAPGEAVRVEKLPVTSARTIELAEVLLVGGEGEPRIGAPTGRRRARSSARSSATAAARRSRSSRAKRRKNYRRKQGHRQELTPKIRVESIEG